MTRWVDRSVEEARLLNPAFLAALLTAAVADFERTAGEPMPWALAFIVPALSLHERTRESLPANIQAHFSSWLQSHPEVRIGFGRRAGPLAPLIREGLRLALRTGVLQVDGGRLRATTQPRPRNDQTEEVAACFRAARFVGRWFARRNDVPTIFGLLGVRP
jgi:Family of unknown function (DUF6521)